MGVVIGADGSAVRTTSSSYAAIRESISDVARQIEDLNWVNLSTDRPSLDLVYDDRKRLLQRIRLYRRRSPLAKNAAGLLQHYVLGKGISLKANNRRQIAPIVDEFWEDPDNAQVFTSHQAQKEAIDGLWTDGDMFVVLFPDTDAGTTHLGMLDALFVEDIIADPNNAAIPRWYKARKPGTKYNFTDGAYESTVSTDFTYYRDWRNPDDGTGKGPRPPKKLVEDGLLYHVRINKRGKFGESELAAAVDWLKAHKDFMEDRATLNRAAAQVAWKKKRRGSPTDVANEVARLQSSLIGNVTRYESNPPAASGSTIVENEGTSLEWVKTDTGAQAASADERTLRMMAGSGMGGIPNHYFGDEANANLATATAMELPLLKSYEDWQKLWGDVISDIIGFVLDNAHKAGRIGDRDDSAKYAERVTTPRAVLGTDQAVPSGQNSMPQAAQLNPASNTAPSTLRESVRQSDGQWYVYDKTGDRKLGGPYKNRGAALRRLAQVEHYAALSEAAAPVAPGGEPGASPAGAAAGMQVRDPAAVLTLIGKTEPVYVGQDETDTSGKVDWFVDVDFPPILAKDVDKWATAIKTLYEFLPPGNIESQKLVVELTLNLLGENNIDEIMERLFPPDATPQELRAQQAPVDAVAGDPAAMLAAIRKAVGADKPAPAMPGQPTPAAPGSPADQQQAVSESAIDTLDDLARQFRVRRVLRAAREASDALAAVGA